MRKNVSTGGPCARELRFKRQRALTRVTAVVLAALPARVALSTTSNSVWTDGAATNLWATAGNWSPAGVPNNGTNGFSDYNVSIGTPAPCILTISPTIDNLTINSGGALDIQYGSTLTVNGPTLTDNGSIVVNNNQGGITTELAFGANTSITGSGTITLDFSGSNAQLEAAAGITVTQAASHTIAGFGQLNLGFVNNGTVNANVSGQSLTLGTYNMTNNLAFQASNGGTLSISGINVTQGASGIISATTGSTVGLSNANVSGGTFNSSGTGTVQIAGTDTLTSVTSNALIDIPYGNALNVSGNLVDNNSIVINSNTGGIVAALNFSGGTVSGTGTFVLLESGNYAQLNGSLTQASGHSIGGYGTINATLTNKGTVNANVSGQTLYVESPSVINTSLMEATAGTLYFDSAVAVNNAGGTISTNGGNITLANGAAISGGTLTAVSPSVVSLYNYNSTLGYTAQLKSLTISAGTEVDIPYSDTLVLSGATFTNNGTIVVNSNTGGQLAEVLVSSNTLLTGTGTIQLQESNSYALLATGTGNTVTQDIHHTINGYGEISATLINNNVVNANINGQTLTLDTNNKINNLTFEATKGGSLAINSILVNQGVNGVITAATGSVVSLNNSNISGGTLTSAGTGSFQIANVSTIASVTSNAVIDIPFSNGLNVVGNLTDNGSIVVNSNIGGAVAALNFSGGTVSGPGTIALLQGNDNAQINGSLNQSSGHTIQGFGQINATVINNGLINANFSGQTLTIAGTLTNNSVIEATGGGILSISGVSVTQSAGAQVAAAINSVVTLTNANITGGTINSSAATSNNSAGYINIQGLDTLTSVTNNAVIDVPFYNVLNIAGNLVNNSSIFVNSNTGGAVAALNFSGGTLSGSGSVILEQQNNNAQINGSVTQSAGHTIQGYGQINAGLTNNGTVNANVSGTSITIAGAVTNNSLIEATNGGNLTITGTTITQGTLGQILEASGSTVSLNSSTITGGNFNGSGVATVNGVSTLNNVTNSTTILIPYYNELDIVNNLVDNGSIIINSNQGGAIAALNFSGGTVSGSGSITLQEYGNNAQLNGPLTQAAGHTIAGYGQIGGTFINNGLVTANVSGQTLSILGTTTGVGTFQASNGGTLTVGGNLTIGSGGSLVGSGANSSIVINSGAQLIENGTISGAPAVTDNGIFNVIANPGPAS